MAIGLRPSEVRRIRLAVLASAAGLVFLLSLLYVREFTFKEVFNILHKAALHREELVLRLVERNSQKLNELLFAREHFSAAFIVH